MEDNSKLIYFLFGSLAVSIPNFIVLIVGMIMCFINRKKSPKASNIALTGILILFLIFFLGLVTNYIQSQLFNWYRDSLSTATTVITLITFVLNLISSVGLGLVIIAVWTGREK